MTVSKTELEGVLIIDPKCFHDNRGYFLETFNAVRYREAGIDIEFPQDNLSFSTKGVLRGLHFQNPNPQAKLVHVLQGEVFDVAVDIRAESPTFRKWVGVLLSSENHRQFYIPAGYAHGFVVLSETALFAYKCSSLYDPSADGSILWNDPEIGIQWPIETPIISEKDARALPLAAIPKDKLTF